MDAVIASKFQGKNVLWIEDDQFLGSMIEKKFHATGCNLNHVTDGEEALKVLKSDPIPDLVIIDLVLPGVDGFEIIKTLREDPRTKAVPAAILSNLSDEKDVQKAKEYGADLYLVKASLTLDEIMEKIAPLFK
ncbi:MAG: response regulator [Candidatus Paceibacterota bacterium]|jgi:CheY-like chemotaxis protein